MSMNPALLISCQTKRLIAGDIAPWLWLRDRRLNKINLEETAFHALAWMVAAERSEVECAFHLN
jgi:hypothetical protein